MAITGLTDQEEALPRIGVLRKGAKKTGNSPGKDLTYFRFEADGENEIIKERFSQAYPDQAALRCINVFLPYATPEENFINRSWIEKWVAGGLEYKSDGETIVRWRMPNGQYSNTPKPDPKPEVGDDGKRADGSRHIGRLTVIIPELGELATVTVITTSKNDVVNISNQLKSFYSHSKNHDLRGIPFVLVRQKRTISTPTGGGNRGRRESWLLTLKTQPHYTQLYLADTERKALPEPVDAIDADWEDAPEDDNEFGNDVPPVEDGCGNEADADNLSFASLDELLDKATEDFGSGLFNRDDIKELLKHNGYKTFSVSKSGEMYHSVSEYFTLKGGNNSEFINSDWNEFCADVVDKIKFYQTAEGIAEAMDWLGIAFDPENTEFIFDQLARHAGNKADQSIALQEADSILGK